MICTDGDGRILLFNRAAELSFGYTASEVIWQHVDMLLPESRRAGHHHQLRSFALEAGEADRLMGDRREVSGRRKNGEEFPAEASVSRHRKGGKTILTVVHRDITERKELEAQREAISQELDHRIRNVLALVNSLVSLSARSAESVAEFKETLLERLGTLARTQGALRFGAQQSTTLSELLLAELAPYRTSGGANVVIEGPPVSVGAKPAQILALVFHELATNSAKYGALGSETGRLTVTAAVTGEEDECRIVIEWHEAGGPPVQPPTRKGFGTNLITQVVKRTFGADVALEYPPEGLVCRMTLPKAKVAAAGE